MSPRVTAPRKELSTFQRAVISRIKALFNCKDDIEIGKILDVSFQIVSNARRGKSELSLYKVYNGLKNRGISFEFLLTGNTDVIRKNPESSKKATHDELLREIERLKEQLVESLELNEMLLKVKSDQQVVIDKMVKKELNKYRAMGILSEKDIVPDETEKKSTKK